MARTSYKYPGVYIEEVSSGARPIEAVGTSTAAFVGKAPRVRAEADSLVWIDNWTQFVNTYVLDEDGEADGVESTPLSHAVYGFFLNGGGRCAVVNIGGSRALSGASGKRTGLDLLEESDEISIVAAPGWTSQASYEALISHCEKLKDRVAVLDAPDSVGRLSDLTGKKRPRSSDGGYAAVYFPHIKVRDPLAPTKDAVVAPSGHVAGIYARSDETRGVHKAPANEIVRGALDVNYRLTREEQGVLNPKGVNCIRRFPGEGIRVYGARTVSTDPEWRYVNVRRLLTMIEESISRATRWAVFEPNDMALWKALRRDTSAFLTSLWRQGALMGATPEASFFVKCDEETNPPEEVAQGRVYVLVGVAPVKPAEFVIFRIGQSAGGSESEAS